MCNVPVSLNCIIKKRNSNLIGQTGFSKPRLRHLIFIKRGINTFEGLNTSKHNHKGLEKKEWKTEKTEQGNFSS